VACYISLAHIT